MYNSVFISLGGACNFNCKYCLQHDFYRKEEAKFNDDIFDFLDRIKQESRLVKVQFFGGEPLMYFDVIEYIVKGLKERQLSRYFSLGMISNGSLLTQEIVDFVNENNIAVAISYDGDIVKYTRGQDVFADEKIKELFLKIKNRGVSAVLSGVSYNYPEIFDQIRKHFPNGVRLNVDRLYPFNFIPDNIRTIDLIKFAQGVDILLERAREQIECGKQDYESDLVMTVNNILKQAIDSKYYNMIYEKPRCRGVYQTADIDIEGNMYICHNSNIRLGTIYDEHQDIIERFKPYNKYVGSDKCTNCPAYMVCQGGCFLLDDEEHDAYCEIEKIFYLKVLNFINSF